MAHSSKASIHVNESVSVIEMEKVLTPGFMNNKIVKWLRHVFIMTVCMSKSICNLLKGMRNCYYDVHI